MKNPPSRQLRISALSLLAILLAACDPPPPGQPKAALTSVDEMVKEAGPYTPIGDKAAQRHFEELSKIFAADTQKNLNFSIYKLNEPTRDFGAYLKRRAENLQIGEAKLFYPDDNIQTPPSPGEKITVQTVGLRNNRVELSHNLGNGSELFVDNEGFHGSKGVPPDKVKTDTFYFKTASQHLEKTLTTDLRDIKLYPYKLRRFMDAISEEQEKGGRSEVVVTVPQVGISYNSAIDGIAVIGPGGKAVVHMDPEGKVVGHEILLRVATEPAATVTGGQIVAPKKALQMTRDLIAERGVKLANYKLSRSEFGYLRNGRNSIQGLVAPFYAFIYEPASEEVVGRRIVEMVPAVAEPEIARLIERDAERESKRKQVILDRAGEPDQRDAPPNSPKAR